MARVGWCGWRGMQGYHVLLLLVFLVDASNLAEEQTAEEYIQLKETLVNYIAISAVENATGCDYLTNCKQTEHCTIAACYQTGSDVADSTCVGVTNNLDCNEHCYCIQQSDCNRALANYNKSYIRVPGLTKSRPINEERLTAICMQKNLDTTFPNPSNKYGYDHDHKFYSFYLGTVDGTFRYFPGTGIEDCSGYDPRVRPWYVYVGAISVIKDLVVLVDTTSSMSN